MRIDPKSKIAGQPALKMRAFLRTAGDSGWNVLFVKNFFKITNEEALQTLKDLAQDGYIEPDSFQNEFWKTTLKGNSLSLASAAASLHRATADKNLKELLERVHQVKSNDNFVYYVKSISVFGSYLTNKQKINDIDLVIELAPKKTVQSEQEAIEKECREKAWESGRSFSSMIDNLFWPQTMVKLFLKNRSRVFSFHETSDGISKQVITEIIY